MKNIRAAVEGDDIVIRVDHKQNFGPSGSGKTDIVGSTAGAAAIETPSGTIFLNINVYKKR